MKMLVIPWEKDFRGTPSRSKSLFAFRTLPALAALLRTVHGVDVSFMISKTTTEHHVAPDSTGTMEDVPLAFWRVQMLAVPPATVNVADGVGMSYSNPPLAASNDTEEMVPSVQYATANPVLFCTRDGSVTDDWSEKGRTDSKRTLATSPATR